MPFAPSPGERAYRALRDVQHEPLWQADPQRPDARPPLVGRSTAELVVVGGGLTGLWTALRAKERDPDRDVVLIEGDRIGNAASGRNGGFVAASITHGHANGIQRWPSEFGQLHELGLENLTGIEETIDRYGIDCFYERTGDLAVATEDYQVPHLREGLAEAAPYGVALEFLDQDATRELIGSPTYRASVRDPDVGLVDPARLCWGLAAAAESLGVRIVEHSPVLGMSRDGAAVEVRTYSGAVSSQHVALATAAHAPLLRRISAFVVPVFDHVVATAPLTDDALAEIGWVGREGVSDSGNQFHYYRLTHDNRILWGGYDAVYARGERPGSDLERDDFLTARLVQHLHDTFPSVAETPVEFAWAGAIDTCSRFSAFWGSAFGGRVVYCVGFTGLGVGASRFGADTMLDLLWGLDTERTRLEMVKSKPLPFPPEPVRQVVIDVTRRSLADADAESGRRNVWLRTLDRLGLGFDS
ncbi:MAG: FAD-dependent oxidoreductase [Candidatus Nanopelagicales bacterium]